MSRRREAKNRIVVSSDEEDEGKADQENTSKAAVQQTGKLKSISRSNPIQIGASLRRDSTKSKTRPSPAKSPAKAKNGDSKSKQNGSAQANVSSKPIYSFFSSTSRNQLAKQPSASPEKPKISLEEPEAIQDESDGDYASVSLSKGSSTALAVRKRKVQHSESFETDDSTFPSGSQKFFKTNKGARFSSLSVINEDRRPWTEQFAPRDTSELAVHKKKVEDVRQWVASALRGKRQKVLVLKGAAGTGKTTTIKLIAQELGLDVIEWQSPTSSTASGEAGVTSYAMQFADFVGRGGRAARLEFDNGTTDQVPSNFDATIATSGDKVNQLLLVEEFPSTFSGSSSTLTAFRSALSQHLAGALPTNCNPTPIVLVVSETLLSTNTALADSFTAHRLLGPELGNNPYLNVIEFNAVAPTFLFKALQTIVLKEARITGRRHTPGPLVLKRIAEAGDIRSAVSSLEFLCLRGDGGDTWSSKVAFSKPKKPRPDPPLTKAEEEALKLVTNRESTLGIFHSIGKVVYNKRVQAGQDQHVAQPPDWLSHYRRPTIPENDIDRLIDELGTDTSTFFAALHENYALSCQSKDNLSTLESLECSIDSISDADLLSIDRFSMGTRSFSGTSTDSLRQDEMAFQLAVRGLWFSLPSPVIRITPADGRKADAHRMFYPASLRLWRKREEIMAALDQLALRLKEDEPRDGQSSGGSTTAPPRGVETWKRGNKLDAPTEDSKSEISGSSTAMNSAKVEMLLERLPYMGAILGSSRRHTPRLLELITKVTRVRDPTLSINDNGEDDPPEEGDIEQETWSTDQPEKDAEAPTPKRKTKSTPWEKQSLPKVVESAIERLVLEEDDIVDD